MMKVAILDDYAKVALKLADWSVLNGKCEITVFDRHLSQEEASSALQPFEVLCSPRTDERSAEPLEHLPKLKMITIVG